MNVKIHALVTASIGVKSDFGGLLGLVVRFGFLHKDTVGHGKKNVGVTPSHQSHKINSIPFEDIGRIWSSGV